MSPTSGPLAPARAAVRARGQLFYGVLSVHTAPQLVIATALLLTGTSLALGFSVDEYFQQVALRAQPAIEGLRRAPWELYTFSGGARENAALMEAGIFPWWTEPDFAIAFFRPLSSLTLWLDHTLWPTNTALMHLHSLIWFGLLLCSVWWVYRAFMPQREVAVLALLLYAVDDARALTVGWISLRNALIALAPAFLALLFHHRARSERSRAAAIAAPCLFALALLGGEVACALLGYLAAYVVFMERGSWLSRARSLVPYAGVLLVYRSIYAWLGYGAVHSDMYVDPVREPWIYLQGLLTRLPVLLFAQFSLPPSELWEAYPLISAWLQPVVYLLVLLGLGVLVWLLVPLWRASRELRFWTLGMLLATLPVCGTFPADRLLVATSLGGAPLLASLIHALLGERLGRGRHKLGLQRRLGQLLVAMNLIFAPAFLTVRARDIELTKDLLEYADRSIPRSQEIQRQTLLMINPPLNALALYFPVYRAATGEPLPRHFRYLATAESDLTVERVDERSLKLRPEGGFLSSLSQRVFRSHDRPLPLGARVRLSDMELEVTRLTPDGRPAELLVRLDVPLEHPSLRWVQWGKRDYVPFTPPAPGTSIVLPRVDALPLLFDVPSTD
jgi:hypothetical protein